ncbi:MAG: hypothetical protein WC600_03320 [Desulfobaccales bacterium]
MAARPLIKKVPWRRRFGDLSAVAVLTIVMFGIGGASLAIGQNVFIHNGFYKGNNYMQLDVEDKAKYCMGLLDGILLSPLFGASKSKLSWLESRVDGIANYQLVAIIDKFMQAHPERWHENMHTLAYSALANAYKK